MKGQKHKDDPSEHKNFTLREAVLVLYEFGVVFILCLVGTTVAVTLGVMLGYLLIGLIAAALHIGLWTYLVIWAYRNFKKNRP